MKCQSCGRYKCENLRPYGGAMICDWCNLIHNPKTIMVDRMTPEQRERIKYKIIDLKSEIHKLERKLRTDDRLVEENQQKMTFIII